MLNIYFHFALKFVYALLSHFSFSQGLESNLKRCDVTNITNDDASPVKFKKKKDIIIRLQRDLNPQPFTQITVKTMASYDATNAVGFNQDSYHQKAIEFENKLKFLRNRSRNISGWINVEPFDNSIARRVLNKIAMKFAQYESLSFYHCFGAK